MADTDLRGLSERDVAERRMRGQGNDVRFQASRSFLQILRQNAFTFINTVLFAIGIVLVLLGRTGDAVVTAGLVLMNVIVGVVQEGRAKRTLDQIALLTRPKATVIRDGVEKVIDPGEIVLGDILVARPGDQIVVDGQVVGPDRARLDVDESLLTGESDLIPKRLGDSVYSGSLCMTGSALYEAQKVGAASLANEITSGARTFRQVKTPLQRDIDLVIRVMVLLASQLGILLAISSLIKHATVIETVQIAAVIVALVPQGLFFMTTVTYAMGAVRMAGKGALIQQANAVESLSHVNMLCLDKTGTLTTNRISFHAAHPIGVQPPDIARVLGDYAAHFSGGNRTIEAIGAAFAGQARRVHDQVSFSSERKWSALAFDDDALRATYILGAPEILRPHLSTTHQEWNSVSGEWAAQGLRVLLLAHRPGLARLHDAQDQPHLPSGMIPLAVLSFKDELRPEAQTTLKGFAEAGIQLKLISGDNPETVTALARQAGLECSRMVSGLDLAAMDEAQFVQAAEEATVLGRITPQQKQELVRALRSKGHYVAMIGDGVNDVLSLKQAHLGIAMQSGSQAARAVADMVLLGDSFAALPAAFREGQRIVRGMQDIVRLFLTRTLYVTLLIVGAAMVGVAFPLTPKDNSILALLTVGIPTLGLAAWARPGPPPRSMLRSVINYVFPAAFMIAAVSLAIYLGVLLTIRDLEIARTALTTTTVLCGILLILFVEPPTPAWVGGDELSGDWRPTILALGMLALYGVVMLAPGLRSFFELASLRALDWLLIGLAVTAWAAMLRFVWRARVMQRLLQLD